MKVLPSLVVPFVLCGLAVSQTDPGSEWANWRGPDGTSVARASNPPSEWSEDNNIRWKVALPGVGTSSPVIWGDRIYVTTSIETDEDGTPPPFARVHDVDVSGRSYVSSAQPPTVYEFAVLAIDREDGAIVWQTTVKKTVPHEGGHADNSQSSGSPTTDGEHIYALFGSRGLYCLNMEGEVQWQKDFGLMQTHLGFGEGMSPVLHGDRLIIVWDHEQDSFIAAFDKKSGAELWRTPRDEQTSWATPAIAPANGKLQVVTAGTASSRAYDLETGELIWTLAGLGINTIPSPTYVDGIVYLMTGFDVSMLQAVRLEGAKGDLSASENLLWFHARNTSYAPSPLVYGDFIYFLRSNSGILSCLDRETGKVHYEGQRMRMRTVYSSPVGAAGRVYLTSREGVTKVISLGPEYDEIATNQLDDVFNASAAIVGDQIFLRGVENLYCIATTDGR